MSGIGARWWDARASGECWVGWKAPVSALEQDLSSQAPKEVVNEDGASEEGLRIVDESHLLQREAQHMGTLFQNRCNLKDIITLDLCNLVTGLNKFMLMMSQPTNHIL